MKKVAVLIVNYNMPERTNALCEAIATKTKWPHDLIVIDNGSDIKPPPPYTNVQILNNVQTTGGWLRGLFSLKERYFAYWFIITSARIPDDQGDILTPMAQLLKDDKNAVGVHPALTPNSTTYWTHLIKRGDTPRRTWMIDNIASLYRADWFDKIGRFDGDMKYAWGIDLETCYLARKEGRSIWVDDRVQVEKITNIGYTMNRMNMTSTEREQKAWANMIEVLTRKYGPNAWEKMNNEYVDNAWR